MEPTYIPTIEPQQNRHIILKIIVIAVALVVIATIAVLVIRAVHQGGLANDVKTELIKQNKLIKTSAKNNIYSPTLPKGVGTTNKVIIDATVSASGTAYCIAGTNKEDTKIVYHMDKTTPDTTPVKGSCSDGATVAPLVPSDFAVGSAGAGVVSLTWNKAPYAATYLVQCANDKDFISGLKGQSTTDTALTITNLTGDTQYYCRIAASNSVGQSEWSAVVTAQTNPISVAPLKLQVSTVSSSELRYSWQAVAGATSYLLEYSTDVNFVNDVVRVSTTATSGSAKNLKSFTGYYFHVKAATPAFDIDHATFSDEQLGRTAK